ncbi:MAG TPA: enoyl-CoA hydratase-related protein [Acidimicrobiia bacterium]|jgi:enoyl-CoA hydratase/carnithine racemase
MVKIELNGPRATITIHDPERRNPLSARVVEDLVRLTSEANANPEVRVIVYTGAGDRAFSAGGDLSSGFFDDPIGLHRMRGKLAELFRIMWEGEKPTVARVNGHALAGGFGLAVAADFTICVDDARLGTPEIGVGLWPMMITVPLLRAIPHKALFDLMATGRVLSPEEALRLGAVSRVVSRADLDSTVDDLVSSLARQSPAVMAQGRRTLAAIAGMSPEAALDFLQTGLTAVTLTEDAREGLAAFAEKRAPVWVGR